MIGSDQTDDVAAIFDEGAKACGYLGRASLVDMAPARVDLLELIRSAFNRALANQRADDPMRQPDERFYLDYIGFAKPTAIAFRYRGFSFIGVAPPLVDQLERLSIVSSRDAGIRAAIGLPSADRQVLALMLTFLSVSFVIGHEYNHHIFGDLAGPATQGAFDEHDVFGEGDLTKQAKELNADGLSTYLVLENLISGEGRVHWVSLLGLEAQPAVVVDRILMSALIVGMTSYFASVPVANSRPYRSRTHPPMSVRLRYLLEHARLWSAQNRPSMRDWLRPHFQVLHSNTIRAVCEAPKRAAWLEEVNYMTSAAGVKYNQDLDAALDARKALERP